MNAQRIVVPLDGSALAEAAVPKAIEIASATPGANITLVRAAEATVFPGRDPIAAQIAVIEEAETYLERVEARLPHDNIPMKRSVWYGPAAMAIVEAAEAAHADLIVMSTHGRSGLNRLVLGSVAESVVRATHVPILLLRPETAPVDRPVRRAEQAPDKEAAHV